jgi:cytochrome c oxidase cbb3-type subunit III
MSPTASLAARGRRRANASVGRLVPVAGLLMLIALAGCQRESRQFEPAAGPAITPPMVRMSELQPARVNPKQGIAPHYEVNAYSLAEGKRLFDWYNCNGCHANGGGGIGPALMDNVWIYGGEPENIYATIVQGRPNGMPSFGGHIPDEQVWQLVAYVRSMSGLVPQDAAPSRNDDIQAKKSENRVDPEHPVSAATPSSAERSQ